MYLGDLMVLNLLMIYLKFDFINSKWEIILTNASISSREAHSFVEYKDKFYVFGGLTIEGQTNDLYSIDIGLTNTWTRISCQGEIPIPRAFHTSNIYKNFIYIFGGHNTSDGWLEDFYEYDIDTSTFNIITNNGTPPSKRGGHKSIIKDGLISICGGYCSLNYFNDLYHVNIK